MEQPIAAFVDYYELMQISHKAEQETIQRVYRTLATRCHPDNPETGDTERFVRLNEAWKVLGSPESRAIYDADYQSRQCQPIELFNMQEFATGIDGEANRRMGLLCLLYHRRRVNTEEPGMSLLELESMMLSAREHLVFTIWYLKDKGYVRHTEDSSYAITSAGVDHVEQGLPKNRVLYRLLKGAEDGTVRATVFSPFGPFSAAEGGPGDSDMVSKTVENR
jgi:curved DNA-binding protein CbpA